MHFVFLYILTVFYSFSDEGVQNGGKETIVASDQFSNDVNDLLQELDEKYSMTESIGNARKKMQKPRFKTWDNDRKLAGMLINLYTNSDENKHLPAATFYRSLNEAIRSENPDFIWQKIEKLLNEALHIIGHETFEYTFRGEICSSIPGDLTEGSSFKVRGFWSTTLDPSFTDHFGGGKHAFYIIKNVQGVNVQHVSVTDMEKEVLVQSSREYILERKISNKEEQRKELIRLNLRYPNFEPSKFDPENIFILVPLQEDGGHDEL